MTQAPSPGVFRRKFLSNSFGVLAMAILFSVAIILTSICAKMTSFAHGEVHKSTDFCIILDNQTGHIKSLRRAGASNNIEFLREDRTLGPVSLRIRKEGNSWRDVVSGDKDLELRSMFELLEAKLRWNIVVFNTGNEAIEIFKTSHNNIDLVILDMIMPGIKGDKVLKEMRKICNDTKIIVASGFMSERQRESLKEEHVDAFLNKPFTDKNLIRTICSLPDLSC